MQILTKLFIQEYNPTTIAQPSEDANSLEKMVENFSFLRHIHLNPESNHIAGQRILECFKEYCDFTSVQGQYGNIVGGWGNDVPQEGIKKHIIGGHYDGPPHSPGADDNASAIASLCLLAKRLAKTRPSNVLLVAFNGEEEGFLGSEDFTSEVEAKSVVVLEMVGYFTEEEGTQQMPEGMPQFSVGNFLGIVGNKDSKGIGKTLVKLAREMDLPLPLKNIQIPMGLENKLSGLAHVKRSDHYPFWKRRITAVMLTDTAEFRNPNYHQRTDTPDTLNYPAMAQVVNLLEAYANKVE